MSTSRFLSVMVSHGEFNYVSLLYLDDFFRCNRRIASKPRRREGRHCLLKQLALCYTLVEC